MASSDVVLQYETDIGYKPESLQKLNAWQKEKGLGLKYSAVKKAFEGMKNDEHPSSPHREIIKSEATNLAVNKSKIEVDLMPTPEAEEAEQKQQKEQQIKMQNEKQKTWTFDVTKATEAIQMFDKLNKNTEISKETLPKILEWANSENINIKMSELKQAFAQKQQFEAMDFPSNNKKKIKKKKKVEKKKEPQQYEAVIELKSMTDYCSDDVIKDLLKIYFKTWNHEPLDAKQLLNFVDEQGLNEKYKMVNFEMLSKFFREYERYKTDVDVNNENIRKELSVQSKKQVLAPFDCKEILNAYVEKHGEPKDVQMFYRYVREIGYDVDFKYLDGEYNKARGIKKKKKRKGKPKSSAKHVLNLYKKPKNNKNATK